MSMRTAHAVLPLILLASPALAQSDPSSSTPGQDVAGYDTGVPPAITVAATATLITDYRFRGLTQTTEDPAVQGSVTVKHESGAYAGVWASTIAGDPGQSLPGYGAAELDLYAGYSRTLSSGVTGDIGLLYYTYPDARSGQNTDYFEPYASVSYILGPATVKGLAAYAFSGQSGLGGRDDLYLAADLSVGVPTTPVTVSAHLGHAAGSLAAFNPNPTDRSYFDWSLGAEAVRGPFVLGAKYIDTDITNRFNFADRIGADATVVAYVGVSF